MNVEIPDCFASLAMTVRNYYFSCCYSVDAGTKLSLRASLKGDAKQSGCRLLKQSEGSVAFRLNSKDGSFGTRIVFFKANEDAYNALDNEKCSKGALKKEDRIY